MSFGAFPGFVVVAGFAALAVGLYLAQRLRIRHREVVVPTLIFWRALAEETRARVFVRRFRHPWAYLFILALASILLLTAAEPRFTDDEGRAVALLDGSAHTADPAGFAAAADALLDWASSRGEGRLSVQYLGDERVVLLAEGEPTAVLRRRLAALRPRRGPSVAARAIHDIAASTSGPLDVALFGNAPLPKGFLDALRDGVTVRSFAVRTPPAPRILELGRATAGAGDPSRSEVYVAVDARTAQLGVVLGDDADVSEVVLSAESGDQFSSLVRGRIGSTIEVAPRTDTLGRARMSLHRPTPIDVRLDAEIPAPLRALIEADGGLRIVADGGLAVGSAAHAALRIADDLDPSAPIRIVVDAARDRAADLRDRFAGIGLDEVAPIDVRPDVAARLVIEEGATRRIELARDLFTDAWNFTGTAAFAILVADGLRWLADVIEPPAVIAVGEPLSPYCDHVEDEGGRTLDAVSTPLSPPRAGDYVLADGTRVSASVLRRAEEWLPAESLKPLIWRVDALGEPSHLLGVLAFVLLLVEWVLHRRGKLP